MGIYSGILNQRRSSFGSGSSSSGLRIAYGRLLVCVWVLCASGAVAAFGQPSAPFLEEPASGKTIEARRTVLELRMDPLGKEEGSERSVVGVVVNGPPTPTLRQELNRDELPFPLSFSIGLLDPDLEVAEIHFFRNDDTPGKDVPFQKVLLDSREEVQAELARHFTLVLKWVELRHEILELIDGEAVYRSAKPDELP